MDTVHDNFSILKITNTLCKLPVMHLQYMFGCECDLDNMG
jgi:hypothetical protein